MAALPATRCPAQHPVFIQRSQAVYVCQAWNQNFLIKNTKVLKAPVGTMSQAAPTSVSGPILPARGECLPGHGAVQSPVTVSPGPGIGAGITPKPGHRWSGREYQGAGENPGGGWTRGKMGNVTSGEGTPYQWSPHGWRWRESQIPGGCNCLLKHSTVQNRKMTHTVWRLPGAGRLIDGV